MWCLQTWLVVAVLAVLGLWLDPMILKVFSNLNNSMILRGRTLEEGWKSRGLDNL